MVSAELREAFAELSDELLEVLQRLVDQAVATKMRPIEAEHDNALRSIAEDRAKAESESQILWAEVSAEQAKLARREAELARQLADFEKEKQAMTRGRADDVLELNIGGERDASVLRSTLCSVEGSMLEASFSGRWDTQFPKDSRGRFFIDYPASVFEPLLNYLREKKLAGPGESPGWPPSVPDGCLGLFGKMTEYYGVAPQKTLLRTPSRFAGTNNSCDIDGTPEAVRISVDIPIFLHGLRVLGPREEATARYTGWLAVRRGDAELYRNDVDYTLSTSAGSDTGELLFDRPLALEADISYDLVLSVHGPMSTCGESRGNSPTVDIDGVRICFAPSPLDDAGTGFQEGVILGIIFTHHDRLA